MDKFVVWKKVGDTQHFVNYYCPQYLLVVKFSYIIIIIIVYCYYYFTPCEFFSTALLPSWLGVQNTLTAPLQRGKIPPNECPVYDTKQSDGEVPVMLELWGMQSTPLLPSLPGPLWPRVVVSDRALSMGQIEQNCILMLNWITWNITVLIFKEWTYAKLNCLI